MTPHHLHALAAAWSLQAARQVLAFHVDRERRHNANGLLDAAPILRSPTYGTRHATGDHGDPTGTLLLDTRPTRDTTWSDLNRRLDGKLRWLADQTPTAPAGPDPWWRLYDALPRLQPGTAATIGRHLTDEERWVRDAIRQPRPTAPLVGVPCPHCGERQLVVQTAGPAEAWTVVCTTGRLCIGPGCGCGMPGAVEGVAHIWPRHVVLGAVAGAAPTAVGETA
ncbi:hypothetical protein CSH63_24895 [Micromonospora tulbaghiae]|uniref:Uncharacterized protein n=1 Tax=Micromonospora tulbaghiae TaxID=479978 RepID=A0A386WRS3_9ACTN|nr:hypothetical protein [Micromonospora tulbaghiae]AYF30622.1 hypothetical protein CSH63_24895 [Micromonospora tulbaghiae]